MGIEFDRQLFRREFLSKIFEEKNSMDSSYSLRSFAKDVNIEASSLGQMLKGKRKITDSSFNLLAFELNLKKEEIQRRENLYISGLSNLQIAAEDFAELQRHWYYFAILELTHLEDFKPNVKWVSNRLKLEESVCRKAIELLFSTSALLESEGRWEDNFENLTLITSEDMDIESGRNCQIEFLDLSRDSILNIPAHEKSHTSVSVAIDENFIPQIKDEIRVFRRRIMKEYVNKSKKKNRIYNMQINLFPLDSGSES